MVEPLYTALRNVVIKTLEDARPSFKSDPMTVLQKLETLIQELIIENTYKEICLGCEKASVTLKEEEFDSHKYQKCFSIEDQFLRLRAVEDPENRSCSLLILIEDMYVEAKPLEILSLEREIPGSARYGKVRLQFPSSLVSDSSKIIEAASRTIEVGYKWVENFVKSELARESKEATEEFYLHIKTLFPVEISQKIWIYAVADDIGISLASADEQNRAITKASENREGIQAWPLEAALSLILVKMSLPNSFSGKALQSPDSMVQVDLKQMNYSMLIRKTEISHFGGQTITAQTIVSDDKISLVAAYPLEIQEIVQAELDRQQPKLIEILNRRGRAVANFHKTINSYSDSSSWAWGAMGEFAGGFTKGYQGV